MTQRSRSDNAAIHPTFIDGKVLRWLQVIAEMLDHARSTMLRRDAEGVRLAYEAEAKVHELIRHRRAQLDRQGRQRGGGPMTQSDKSEQSARTGDKSRRPSHA